MGTITRGYSWGATEEVTAAKLHTLVDSATISAILTVDISDAQITNAKVNDVSGAKLTTLTAVPSGAGVIPAANLTSVAQKGANSDITSLSGITTPLSVAQGGTGATAAANTANGVVVLDGSTKLPAVDGSNLTSVTVIGANSTITSLTGITSISNIARVVAYTGDGNLNRTVAHGLGRTPIYVMIVKDVDTAEGAIWITGLTAGGCKLFNGSTSTNDIKGVDATNITLGNSTLTNENAKTYVMFVI